MCGRKNMPGDNLPLSIEAMMKSAFEYELQNILPLQAMPPEASSEVRKYFVDRIKEMNEHMKA
jgi:hypothetical protein